MKKRLLFLGILVGVLALGSTPVAMADHTSTEFVTGNPSCDGTKIEGDEGLEAGTYPLIGGGYIVITLTAGNTFSFDTEGSALVSSITVKGGPNALTYTYEPPVTSDTGLHAPTNPNNGKYYGLSHICVHSEKKDGEPDPKK